MGHRCAIEYHTRDLVQKPIVYSNLESETSFKKSF